MDIPLIDISPICHYASMGNSDKVSELIELYRYNRSIAEDKGCPFEEKLLCELTYKDYGPMHWALYNEHLESYKLLRKNMDVFADQTSSEQTLPELLSTLVGHTSYEPIMLVLDEVTPEMCSQYDIKRITDELASAYNEWAMESKENENISDSFWGDESFHVAIKLNIEPAEYMLSDIGEDGCKDKCRYYESSNKHCRDLNRKIEKFHLDNYERIKKSIQL